ncbi:unnamed protein product [Callosobruchus maculatus]|uniref:Uncharacterized protein n=1 Tax=Callosobruchus maculatus TaxID=64391 RepID=A0A653BSY8_CALMS|nr:unnamed protein product [Callosobruchus maculatus]
MNRLIYYHLPGALIVSRKNLFAISSSSRSFYSTSFQASQAQKRQVYSSH